MGTLAWALAGTLVGTLVVALIWILAWALVGACVVSRAAGAPRVRAATRAPGALVAATASLIFLTKFDRSFLVKSFDSSLVIYPNKRFFKAAVSRWICTTLTHFNTVS